MNVKYYFLCTLMCVSLLSQCSPPLEVKDLLVDIKDGKILMALLEVLSGQNLVCGFLKDYCGRALFYLKACIRNLSQAMF